MAIQIPIALPPAGAATNRKVQYQFDALVAIINSTFVSSVAAGAANRLAYYSAVNTVGPLTAITASRALASDSNGLPVAATTTTTELNFVSGVTSAIQTQFTGKASTTLNNLGTTACNAAIIPSGSNSIDIGTSSALWRNIFGVAFKCGASGTQGQLDIFPGTSNKGKLSITKSDNTNADNTTINVATQGGAYTYTVPDAGASASFVMTESAQTINGAKTLGSTVKFASAAVGTPNGFSTDTDNGFYYIGTDNWGLSAGGTKCVDIKAAGTAIIGTNTNNNAAAGFVGEYVESVTTGTIGTTATWTNATSISLTAGDWDVCGLLDMSNNGGTHTRNRITIGVNSGTTVTDLVAGSNYTEQVAFPNASQNLSFIITSYRISISATTTVYLKYNVTYTGTASSFACRLSARRLR